MSLQITYNAPLSSMGDITESEAEQFRSWAGERLNADFPDAIVTVSADDSTVQCHVSGAESSEQEDEIKLVASRLWDQCPWDFE